MSIDVSTDWADAEESSNEYITADDGYDADIEVPIKTNQEISSKRQNRFDRAFEANRNNAVAHPALCSLTLDLLIYFSKR